MAYWSIESEKSVLMAWQSAWGTAATTGFQALDVEMSVPEHARDTEDMQFGVADAVSRRAPAIGGKARTTFTISGVLQSCKSGYDPTSEAPITNNDVLAYTSSLIAWAVGGVPSLVTTNQKHLDGAGGYAEDYDATGTQSATSSAITVAAVTGSNYDDGNLVAVSTATADTVPQVGFIKSIAGDVLTLFEASRNTSAASDKVWPTATFKWSADEPKPLTIRVQGPANEEGLEYADVICTGGTLTPSPGGSIKFELSCMSGGVRKWDATIGGLSAPTKFIRVPPAVGSQGSYYTFKGAETCLSDLSISWSRDLHLVPGGGAAGDEGFCDFVFSNTEIKASVAIPYQTADTITSGDHVHETDMVAETLVSLGVYIGIAPGKSCAILLPSMHHASVPKLETVEGALYNRLDLRADAYSGDGASTKNGNSNARIAFW